ncbi:glutathione S-transferase family protein [Neogemmobacter tilapiae]|uniref:glutathione S-transferase family protein n=1 Tax=Neogemmobacter tilapiae TaxID=875041 RepID=UPI001672B8A1|nr:glutathione S-transferase family protein [Gemmobacter tilapiae]
MVTIYGVYRSRASRPLWLLGEIGMEFEHVPVIQAYRLGDAVAPDAPLNTNSPRFRRVNPMGQIPAMRDGDLTLTESLAITLYLAQQYGGDLGPKDPVEIGEATNWGFFAATAIEPHALDIMMTINRGDAETDAGQVIIDKALEPLHRGLARLDQHLLHRDHVMGERFTVADIVLAECCRYAQSMAGLVQEYPSVQRWLTACQRRPAFLAFWEKRMAEPA